MGIIRFMFIWSLSIFCLMGCSSRWNVNVKYEPVFDGKIKNTQFNPSSYGIVVLPVIDSRPLPPNISVPITNEERKRAVGGHFKYVTLLNKPVADIVYDAIVIEVENVGYNLIQGPNDKINNVKGRYHIEADLKLAQGVWYWGPDFVISNVILDYKIKSRNDEILKHDVIDEVVSEKIRFSSNPGTIGTQIIKKCLPKVMSRLLDDINIIIESDVNKND